LSSQNTTLSYSIDTRTQTIPRDETIVNPARFAPITDVRFVLFFILTIGFAVRIVAALVVPDQSGTLGDVIAYREAGKSLWATGQLGSPFHMPLYPALVAVTGPGWTQLLIDIGLSTAMIWLVYDLANLIFANRRTALLASALTAVYPYFIFFSVVGLTETLFMTLIVAAYVCWYRNMHAAAAMFSVLAILTRPIFDPLAPILVLYFALAIQRLSIGAAIKKLIVYAAMYCLLMAPWWLHNYNAYGNFVRLNLGSGLALYSANNPLNQTGGIDTKLDVSTAAFGQISDPIARDKALRDAAVAYIKDNPERFLIKALLKFERFWYPWPHTEKYNSFIYIIISLCSFVPVLVMALVFLILWGRPYVRRIAPLVLFGVYLTTIHMIFPGSLRYRLPLEPFLIVLAAAGTIHLAERWRRGQILAVQVSSVGNRQPPLLAGDDR
jgi:4-amino-4-deoxy-L-arabinose transferase-like glycosyltransferase